MLRSFAIGFIQEQGVPEPRERDGLDVDCLHVLARDESGQPIGCGRLTSAHKIGRMAVLAPWRGQGVGVALLRELIARARLQGWPEVALDAQVSAIGFYEREGFVAHGEEFEDAGLAHRAMRLPLPQVPTNRCRCATSGTARRLARRNGRRASATAGQCTPSAGLYLPLLDNHSYAQRGRVAELRRIATSGRGAEIRMLLHDPAAALRNDHRLIALAQRLPSVIAIRTPVEETDLAFVSAYLLNDTDGYLFLPEADRQQGRAALDDRASQAPLQQHFDTVWERGRASILQTLDL